MSTLSFALRDSATMLQRDIRHSLHNLPGALSGLLVPIIILVLFVYVFGGAIGAGLGGVTHGGAYIDYLAPGIIFQFLSFTSSALVRPDSMSGGVRWFAEYQPFTPVINTVRGLLLGTPIGNSAVLAVAWCVGLTLIGYLWARAVYNRNSAR